VDASPHDRAPPVHAHPRDEKFAAEGNVRTTRTVLLRPLSCLRGSGRIFLQQQREWTEVPPPPDVRERHRGSLGGEAPGTSNKGGAPVDASPHDRAPPVHAHPRDEKFAAEGVTTLADLTRQMLVNRRVPTILEHIPEPIQRMSRSCFTVTTDCGRLRVRFSISSRRCRSDCGRRVSSDPSHCGFHSSWKVR